MKFCHVLISFLALVSAAKAQVLVDSINAGATPYNVTYGVPDVGYLYVPSTSYELNRIETKFASGSNLVTLVIYTNVPGSGGTLLASGTFTDQPNVFSGPILNTTLHFTSGQSYFIGFENVSGLGTQTDNSPGAVSTLGALGYYDMGNQSFSLTEANDFASQPILEFFSPQTQFAGTPGLTPNEQAVASSIDQNSLSPSANLSSLITILSGLPTAQLPAALSQLSPQAFGQFSTQTAFNNASFATEQLDTYLESQRGPDGSFLAGGSGIDTRGLTVNDPDYDPNLSMIHSRLLAWNPAPADGVVSDVAAPVLGGADMTEESPSSLGPRAGPHPWNVYVNGSVVLAQGFSSPNVSHFDDTSSSVVLGADYRITPHFLIGLTAGYGHTDATLDDNGSSATADSYSPGVYASYADKGWYADFTGNYVHNVYTQDRVIGFLGQTAHSAPDGNEGVVNLDGGYDFHHGALTCGPLAGLQYTHLSVDGYNESGSIADLSVNSQDANSLRSRLGGRVSYAFSQYGVNFTPHLDASWQHEFMDPSRGITSQFQGNGLGSFNVQTDHPSRDSALIDFGLDAQLNDMFTLFADYEVQAGQENYFGQSVQAGLKIGF